MFVIIATITTTNVIGERVPGSLGREGAAAGQPGVHLDDAELLES